jgi:hypothetical protein
MLAAVAVQGQKLVVVQVGLVVQVVVVVVLL